MQPALYPAIQVCIAAISGILRAFVLHSRAYP